MQQDTESCLENTCFVKSHLKDTKELEFTPPPSPAGQGEKQQVALTGEPAGDRWQEKHVSLSRTFWSHTANDENAISWPGEPIPQTIHEKTPRTKAQGQRSQSHGQGRSRSNFKATCNGRNIRTFTSQPNEIPKPLNINKYQSTAFILGTRWMKP